MVTKKFSKSWNRSIQIRKQRKYRINAPHNIKNKLISSQLTKKLKEIYGKRSISLRKGDIVKIMVGEFKGKKGKVSNIFPKQEKVFIEGIEKTKINGTKFNVSIHPSNLQIEELILTDKKRIVKKTKQEINKNKLEKK